MPKFKSAEFIAQNDAGAVDKIVVEIDVSTDGTFYAHVPEKLRVSFKEDRIAHRVRQRAGFFVTSAPTLAEIERAIMDAHKAFMRPKVTQEPVIRYNIESHVSFAMDEEGRIFPNAGYPGASWPSGKDRNPYGDHDASHPSAGGYSLTVGAEAMLKTTTTFGENKHVKYSSYNKGESHLGHENPAQLLNSWCSMHLPDDAREMPYSDEAAMFFFNLLMGMAELNRRVQEFTNTPEKLALAIKRNSGALMLPAPAAAARGKK